MKKIFSYLHGLGFLCFISIMGMIIEAICELALPSVSNMIYEKVNASTNSDTKSYVIIVGMCMILLALLGLAGGLATMKSSSIVANKFSYRLRKDLYSKISDFSFKNIDKFSTSSLTTRLTNDVTQLQNTLLMGLRILVRAPALMVISAFFAFSISKRLSLILLIILPVVAIIAIGALKIGFPMFKKMQKKIDTVNRVVQENLIGIRVVKAYVREENEKKKFHDASDDLMAMGAKAAGLIIAALPMLMLVMNIVIVFVYFKGSYAAANGEIAVGQISVFAQYIVQVLMNVMMTSMMLIMLARAKACLDRIVEVLEEPIDIVNPENPFIPEEPKGEVEFKNVSFAYNTESENGTILSDINFKAPAGSVVGIIGSTGCGKSSLVNLIPRLYDVTSGEIKIDGVNVKDYDLYSLRELTGVVLQKNVLFSGTIKDNIRWGKKDASDDEIIEACKLAQADDFISKQPDGYDTDLSQGGLNLSGGQKQRLCIARAIIKDPKILILDDSTSAVDTATESKIRETFYSGALKDTTVFIIAQRISSVQDADIILVIEDGKIDSIGTHSELLETSEVYQEIFETQQKGVME